MTIGFELSYKGVAECSNVPSGMLLHARKKSSYGEDLIFELSEC